MTEVAKPEDSRAVLQMAVETQERKLWGRWIPRRMLTRPDLYGADAE